MNNKASCTIILPCYNPERGWAERVLEQYQALSAEIGVPVSIVLVNDGSTTGVTEQDLETLQEGISSLRYIVYAENRGKGYALRKGVAAADTDIIIYTDIDFPYTLNSVAELYNGLNGGGFDVAIGIKNDTYYTSVPPVRRYISRLLRAMISLCFNIPVSDTQCGLKGFTQSVKKEFLATEIDRYLFDLEFVRRVYGKKYRIHQVKVQLNSNIVFRRMNYQLIFPEILNFMKIMFNK